MRSSNKSELLVLVHPDRTIVLSNSTLVLSFWSSITLQRDGNSGLRHVLQVGLALCLLLLVDHH